MKTLYLENYKGFKNTYIPFRDVNFLVGENSTGKTAVLNLLNILSRPEFWINPEFNNDTVELGYFNEIVNQCSLDKSFFEIGIEYKDKKNSSKFFLMKFKNKKNLPSLSEYMTVISNNTVLVSLHNSSIDYQTNDYKGESFKEWIAQFNFIKESKKKHSITQHVKLAPFCIIRNIVEMDIKSNSANKPERGAIITPIFTRMYWFSPIRAKAQRTYESFKISYSSEGNHTPNVLRELLSSKTKNKSNPFEKLLNDFGKESGLFDGIKIDEFGKTKGAPYAINILFNSLPVKITNVGYGVTQVMPLVVEIITSKNSTFSIQQPEVHLHPKAQATFGEFIYDSAVENKNRFIIETHSDFTINRFRYKMFKSEEKKVTGQILFFERFEKGTKVTPIPIEDNGQYSIDQPENYKSFFIDEELKMLEI